jgi:hypothetical protein
VSRRIRTLYCAMALGLAAGICTIATPAQAEPSGTPSGCSSMHQSSYGMSYCAYGVGWHRVKITCQRASNPNVVDIIYGNWQRSGYYSDARCHLYGDLAISDRYQLAEN